MSFICSDRWFKSRYGRGLRALVAERYHLSHVVDMVGTKPFTTDASAYTAITTIVNEPPGPTASVRCPTLEATSLHRLSSTLNANLDQGVEVITQVARVDRPWLLGEGAKLGLLRALEDAFLPLDQAGGRVGIGVATGCDRVFIAPYAELPVEPERKLPLAMRRDLKDGKFVWGGMGLVNPFEPDGKLADPEAYPLFAAFIEAHRAALSKRYVARKFPNAWFRTIDKIDPLLTHTPKLLIPDIQNGPNVVFEPGSSYPHHNLYWVTSLSWDLRALQAVLRSDIARLFVWGYSTRLRGGYLRFQAQHLRRICLPNWCDLREDTRETLITLGDTKDNEALNAVVSKLYGLTGRDRKILERGQ